MVIQKENSPLLQLPNTFRAFYGAFVFLHTTQKQAISPILNGKDLILQAATGSGKSEAVLAPSLERVILSAQQIAVLYLIPTRALAYDLKRRFESIITERLGLNLAIRTGDIKRTGGKRPDIMFTTPESLDVMLTSSNQDLKGFLSRIRTLIIDEVHPLVNQYRGRHLACLLTRLERRTGCRLQKIAMSATIADIDSVIAFFEFSPQTRKIVTSVKRDIHARLVQIKQEESEIPALLDDLYTTWKYKKILVFANSRGACDRLFSIVNNGGKFQNVCELHYSNLKPSERKKAEKRLRNSSHALCIATSTLELGIDVGDVDAVLLYEPPGSVSAFLQRIGRSNRRQNTINFWGLCQGEQAWDQLVRFLALLELSCKGKVEAPTAKMLPSVLSQQVISCLFEKKQISLPALQSLFSQYQDILPDILASLQKKNWLKETKIKGLLKGGWQYRNHLFEYKIWGNFPEAEEEYVLDVAQKAIADLPKSIVGQMSLGDKVYIAGKRLQILKIDGKEKKVSAKPYMGHDEKQLAWIGTGAHVSFEVAKAMAHILKTGKVADQTRLFNRTQILFQKQRQRFENPVVLENGIKVVSGQKARYRYNTFLGSAGNLVLEWCIRECFLDDDLYISSDEIGLQSSHWIKFEDMCLPENRKEFQNFIKRHFKILSSILSLNLFFKTLPKTLQIDEIIDFLYDDRVIKVFVQYAGSSSTIISGDISALAVPDPIGKPREIVPIDITAGYALLPLEKQKIRVMRSNNGGHTGTGKRLVRRLTAAMISEYFFHAQCERWLVYKMYNYTHPVIPQKELKTILQNQGIRHEKRVMDHLKTCGKTIIAMDKDGPLDQRFKKTLDQLKLITESLLKQDTDFITPVFLSQTVLKIDALDHEFKMEGIGIPDLLVFTTKQVNGNIKVFIEAGDIKAGHKKQYHHKWQVAFYALLLEKIIINYNICATVLHSGFILSCSDNWSGNWPDNWTEEDRNLGSDDKPGSKCKMPDETVPRELPLFNDHRFDLDTYMVVFPQLFKVLHSIVLSPASETNYQLQSPCVACDRIYSCCKDALENEDIQFIPGLTNSELAKMRKSGWSSIEQSFNALKKLNSMSNEENDAFTAQQKKSLLWRCRALIENQIYLIKENTRLYPNNMDLVCFLYFKKDPITGNPNAFGWQIFDESFAPIKSFVWTIYNELLSQKYKSQKKRFQNLWYEFSDYISDLWKMCQSTGKTLHIFHFGFKARHDFLEWGGAMGQKTPAFLWQTCPSSWTDLKNLFAQHFYMPVPGTVSLHSLGHIFGLNPKFKQPDTLFHQSSQDLDQLIKKSMVINNLDTMKALYEKARLYLKSQWTLEKQSSLDYNSNHLSDGNTTKFPLFQNFIKEERRLKENDIFVLQELVLGERIERFRAIGYLSFLNTRLDHEGRFLYVFSPGKKGFSSKFRKGDFLKLAPHGSNDVQQGFSVIFEEIDMAEQNISLLSRSGRLGLSKDFLYSLEEDAEDWNTPKLLHAAERLAFMDVTQDSISNLLEGRAVKLQPDNCLFWLNHWLKQNDSGLNPAQLEALTLPFKFKTSLIHGPPGTGKTHLLGWILIALIMQAHSAKRPIRIGVSALTHQAIDNVLNKVEQLVNQFIPNQFPGHIIKWGRPDKSKEPDHIKKYGFSEINDGGHAGKNDLNTKVVFTDNPDEVREKSFLIIGATGYGFYHLFNSKDNEFPKALDWVIFDEASQVPIPQALLSLMYGRGNFLFMGDTHQLPPIILGDYENMGETLNLNRSILENFKDMYPVACQVELSVTYRMNKEICAFPNRMWYQDKLKPAPANADTRLLLEELSDPAKNSVEKPVENQEEKHELDRILNPQNPLTLVLTDHFGCSQKSDTEAELMAKLACRLILDHGVSPKKMALISPHRAQNNAITVRLEKMLICENKEKTTLPVVDTIERIQGAQRDIIIFGLTCSDPDYLLTDFLNNPNRLNVAMTRAKTKLIIIGSDLFFSAIPDSEVMLKKNRCFKELLEYCKIKNICFSWNQSL